MLKEGLPQKYLPAYMRLAKFLACHDFRVELRELARSYGASERAVRDYLRMLRDVRVKASHVRVGSALGLKPVIVKLRERIEARVLDVLRGELGYLVNYKELVEPVGDAKALVVAAAPEAHVERVRSLIEERLGPSVAGCTVCDFIPLNPCSFLSKLGEVDVEEVQRDVVNWEEEGYEEARRIASVRLEGSELEMGLVFISALDMHPLASRGSITDASRLESLMPSDAPEWARKVIRRNRRRLGEYYDCLSAMRVLGRVLVWGFQEAAPLLVHMDASEAPLLHLLVSASVATDGVIVCDDGGTYAIMPALARLVHIIYGLRRRRAATALVYRGVRYTWPLHMWDYRRKAWLPPPGG